MHDVEALGALGVLAGPARLPVMAGLLGFVLALFVERYFQLARMHQPAADSRDEGSYTLVALSWYGAIVYSLLDAFFWQLTTIGPSLAPLQYVAVALLAFGIGLRVVARMTLDKEYSHLVQSAPEHRLVTHGVYARIRHPAYLGTLCIAIGVPLCVGSAGGLLIALAACVPAVAYRIRVEERALADWFGDEYRAYADRTAGLIPGIW
jgi:protein-S-isoprenylcysteine O-methyltransferase